jgi:ATPase subunit of ABC transporter with duplicated ATPase domains
LNILLLDEPTNNLDAQGIEHLTGFLMMYEKTVLVISHDADFLNAFSDGVLYLDVVTKKVCSRGHVFYGKGPCPVCWPGRLKVSPR